MYLWCSKCHRAHLRTRWKIAHKKYGSCPYCGCGEYRNTVEWHVIARANSYPDVPEFGQTYPPNPELF